MKTELWDGHNIRFVNHKGEWWAVAKDVCQALGLGSVTMALKRLDDDVCDLTSIEVTSDKKKSRNSQEVNIINEFGVYKLIMTSRKAEAREFERWVFNIIKTLRKSTGLEGFEIFRLLDKEKQKEAMANLNSGLKKPIRIDFIKANTIANKAVSNKHGYPKMLKKADMPPDMLVDRQEILDDTVGLMTYKDKFNLNLSVSDEVYKMANGQQQNTG